MATGHDMHVLCFMQKMINTQYPGIYQCILPSRIINDDHYLIRMLGLLDIWNITISIFTAICFPSLTRKYFIAHFEMLLQSKVSNFQTYVKDICIFNIFRETGIIQDLTGIQSTRFQVTAWCRQATSYFRS